MLNNVNENGKFNTNILNNLDFILELKTKAKIKLICYKRLIKKESHDAIKNAGCDIIVTNASIVMNIQKLVKNLLK